jgi:FkbM family methyltransferase
MSFLDEQVMIATKAGKQRYNILDLGAFKGDTVAKYRELMPTARVYAFEPMLDMCEVLSKRFAGQRWFHLVPKAVSDKVGTATFYKGGSRGNQSSLYPRPFDGRRYYLNNLRPMGDVQTTTIDTFMRERKIAHVDIMKADVHGAFPSIMRGMDDALAGQKIDIIGVEVYFVLLYKDQLFYHELVTLMEGYGYTVYGLSDFIRDRENHQLTVANATFVSHRFRLNVLNTFPETWKPLPKGGT